MTPDLQLSGADARIGASRLAEAHDSPALTATRHSLTHDRPLGRLAPAAHLDGVAHRSIPARPRDGDADVDAGPALTLDAAQLERVGALFKLLSDKTRLAILQILCDGEMNVTALCRRLKLPQPTVSHHLGLLRMNRLIANRRSGKQVYYQLHDRVRRVNGARDVASLDHAGPAGIQIVDERFSLQIVTRATGGDGPMSKLQAPVHATA